MTFQSWRSGNHCPYYSISIIDSMNEFLIIIFSSSFLDTIHANSCFVPADQVGKIFLEADASYLCHDPSSIILEIDFGLYFRI